MVPPSPYCPEYVLDSIVRWPRYVNGIETRVLELPARSVEVYYPTEQSLKYVRNWRRGQYGKRLAEFINKVLEATGASQVDIVAHCMGGLVTRAAMAYYGCKDKIRKILMISTPNCGVSSGPTQGLALSYFAEWPEDMFYGEGAELGVDSKCEVRIIPTPVKPGVIVVLDCEENVDITFTNLNTGDEKEWTAWLNQQDWEGNSQYSMIRGNRNPYECGLGYGDGVIDPDWCLCGLDNVKFSPIIFASHSHMEANIVRHSASGEFSLTECTYTTEFIKKWIIDDEEIVGGQLAADPILSHEGDIHWRGDNYYGRGASLRLYPHVNDFQNILTAHVAIVREVETGWDKVEKSIGVPLYKCENPMDALVIATNPFRFTEDDFHAQIWLYDMNGYIWDYEEEGVCKERYLVIEHVDSAKILPVRPKPGEIVLTGWNGLTYQIDWWTNDYGVRRVYRYSTDGGNRWYEINDDGYVDITSPGIVSYTWNVSRINETTSIAKVKVEYYIGKFAKLENETDGYFTLRKPPIHPQRWNKWLAGDVRDIEVAEDAPNYVFAIVDNKLFKSSDFGKTWEEIRNLPTVDKYHLAVSRDGKHILVGVENNVYGKYLDVFWSWNGGFSFFNIRYSVPARFDGGGRLGDVEIVERGGNYELYLACHVRKSDTDSVLILKRPAESNASWAITHELRMLGNYSLSTDWAPVEENYLYVASGTELYKVSLTSDALNMVFSTGITLKDLLVMEDANGEPVVYLIIGDNVWHIKPALLKDGVLESKSVMKGIDSGVSLLSLGGSYNRKRVITCSGWYACGVYIQNVWDNNWEKITARWGSAPQVVEVSPVDAFSNSWNGIYY
ncbi:hypothetical protein DRQ18_07945, partial [bacterium]